MNTEYGICDICGKETTLERTYFEYKINCECHRGEHSEVVKHCFDCVPTIPSEINVPMLTYKNDRIEVKFTIPPFYIFGRYKENK